MKTLIFGIILSLVATVCLTTASWAGDSATIGVSITIPAIPGVNAPPFPNKDTSNADKIKAVQAYLATQAPGTDRQITQSDPNNVLMQDKKEEVILADGSASQVTTQTIYSR